jgi:hypothetical protein
MLFSIHIRTKISINTVKPANINLCYMIAIVVMMDDGICNTHFPGHITSLFLVRHNRQLPARTRVHTYLDYNGSVQYMDDITK